MVSGCRSAYDRLQVALAIKSKNNLANSTTNELTMKKIDPEMAKINPKMTKMRAYPDYFFMQKYCLDLEPKLSVMT